MGFKDEWKKELNNAEKAEIDWLLYETEIDLIVFEQISRIMETLLAKTDNDDYLIEYYDKGNTVLKNYMLHAHKIKNYELFPAIENVITDVSTWDRDEIGVIKKMLFTKQKMY